MTTARGRELRIHFEVDAGTSCLAPLPPPTSTYFLVGRNAVQKGEFDLDDSTPSGPRAPEQVVLGSKSEPNTPLIYYYFPVVDMLSWLRKRNKTCEVVPALRNVIFTTPKSLGGDFSRLFLIPPPGPGPRPGGVESSKSNSPFWEAVPPAESR